MTTSSLARILSVTRVLLESYLGDYESLEEGQKRQGHCLSKLYELLALHDLISEIPHHITNRQLQRIQDGTKLSNVRQRPKHSRGLLDLPVFVMHKTTRSIKDLSRWKNGLRKASSTAHG